MEHGRIQLQPILPWVQLKARPEHKQAQWCYLRLREKSAAGVPALDCLLLFFSGAVQTYPNSANVSFRFSKHDWGQHSRTGKEFIKPKKKLGILFSALLSSSFRHMQILCLLLLSTTIFEFRTSLRYILSSSTFMIYFINFHISYSAVRSFWDSHSLFEVCMSELLLSPLKVTVHTLLINKAACNQNEVLRDFGTEQRFWDWTEILEDSE